MYRFPKQCADTSRAVGVYPDLKETEKALRQEITSLKAELARKDQDIALRDLDQKLTRDQYKGDVQKLEAKLRCANAALLQKNSVIDRLKKALFCLADKATVNNT